MVNFMEDIRNSKFQQVIFESDFESENCLKADKMQPHLLRQLPFQNNRKKRCLTSAIEQDTFNNSIHPCG